MKDVQQLLDEVFELPIDDFESFDETYKKYRIEKRRESFLKAYHDSLLQKKQGKLFTTESVEDLRKWLHE